MNENDRKRIAEWVDRLIDDELEAEDFSQFQELLEADEEAREFYLDLTHHHAHLQLDRARLSSTEEDDLASSVLAEPKRDSQHSSVWFGRVTAIAVSIAIVAACVSLFFFPPVRPDGSKTQPVAKLAKASQARWGESTLPTAVGSPLGPGRLQIERGLATIEFASGAELVLEAPAELEIRDELSGILHRGTAMVEVPPSAHGFTLATPNAIATDRGTAFAVTVDSTGRTTVEVLDGEVEVKHASSDAMQRVFGDQVVVATEASLSVPGPAATERMLTEQPDIAPANLEFHRITTATGSGRDATVIQRNTKEHSNPNLIMVKNCRDDYRRKGYLAFDLQSLKDRPIVSARLTLSQRPSGFGYATLVPPTKFTVYGLTDESLDDWSAESLRWETAPANIDPPARLDAASTTRLGEFEIPRGQQHGQAAIEGDALVEFLNRDTNGVATLILVRDTPGNRPAGLVHAFANHRHPTAPPPTLELQTVRD